jgi:hypothetical protein
VGGLPPYCALAIPLAQSIIAASAPVITMFHFLIISLLLSDSPLESVELRLTAVRQHIP